MTLTRADLTEHLIKKLNFPKAYAQSFVDDFFEVIIQSLEKGEDVKLSGFGSFVLKQKGERPGRNPLTGEEVTISARNNVSFYMGSNLRNRMYYEKPKENVDTQAENKHQQIRERPLLIQGRVSDDVLNDVILDVYNQYKQHQPQHMSEETLASAENYQGAEINEDTKKSKKSHKKEKHTKTNNQ